MRNARVFVDKLERGEICLGTGISLVDPTVSEALSTVFDFFWIDMEHGSMSLEHLKLHLMAMNGSDTTSLVRVPWNDPVLVKPVLDLGADGVILPMVRNADDVARAVSACRYPPEGIRGFGPLRPLNYGLRNAGEYCTEANENILVVVQIEQAEAVENIDEILSVPGLTSLAFGPNDLAASMGYRAQTQHPKVLEAMRTVIEKARERKIPVGIATGGDVDALSKVVDMGVQWLSIGLDVMLMTQAGRQLVNGLRERITQ